MTVAIAVAVPILACWAAGLLLAARGSLVRAGLAMGLGTIGLAFALQLLPAFTEMLL